MYVKKRSWSLQKKKKKKESQMRGFREKKGEKKLYDYNLISEN